LYQLQELNQVGFEIHKKSIPLASELLQLQKKQDIDPYRLALHFGGDYELLVTMPSPVFEKIKKTLKRQGVKLSAIGMVTRGKDIVLFDGKHKDVLENKGYEHFKKHNF
jgi:thiamine monophosphate kinase